MPRSVVFRPEAEAEAVDVREWYESRSSGLGRRFGEALGVLVHRISEEPLVFPRVHGEVRRAILQRFPYTVYFRATVDAAIVLAIHGRQHPSRWQSRT